LRAQELKSLGVSFFLPKPYSTEKLLTMLHQLLGGGSNSNPDLRLAI
jgi:hypothetical protein